MSQKLYLEIQLSWTHFPILVFTSSVSTSKENRRRRTNFRGDERSSPVRPEHTQQWMDILAEKRKFWTDMCSPDWSLQLGLVGRVGGTQEGEGGEAGGRAATSAKEKTKSSVFSLWLAPSWWHLTSNIQHSSALPPFHDSYPPGPAASNLLCQSQGKGRQLVEWAVDRGQERSVLWHRNASLVVLVYTMCITSLGWCLVHLQLILADSHDYLDIYLYTCLAITLAVRGMIFQAGCQAKEAKANKLAGF